MPVVRKQIGEVRSKPIPNVNIPSLADETTFGGGAAGAKPFQDLEQFGNQQIQRNQELKNQADKIAIRDSDLELQKSQVVIEKEAREFKGRNAEKANEYAKKQWKVAVDNARKGVTSEAQKLEFDFRVQDRSMALDRTVQIHMASEFASHDKNQLNGTVSSNRIDAGANFSQPDRIAKSIISSITAIEDYAERNGLGKDWSKDKISQMKNDIHVEVASRMLISGDPELADQYVKANMKDIDANDGMKAIDRARRESNRVNTERRKEYENQVRFGILDNQYGLIELREDLDAGRIDFDFFDTYKARLEKINDDPEIPEAEKSKRFFEVVDAFLELKGTEINEKTGLPKEKAKPGQGNRTQVDAFRKLVADSADHLTDAEEKAFTRYTQKAFNTATEAKMGIFSRYMRDLSIIANATPEEKRRSMRLLFGLLDESVSVEKASEVVEIDRRNTIAKKNPNSTQYKLGQIVTNPQGVSMQVVGYDEYGNPLFDRIKR